MAGLFQAGRLSWSHGSSQWWFRGHQPNQDQFSPVVWQVAVDGTHLLHYNHRVALQRVNTLCISGSVHVSAVGVLPTSVSSGTFSCCDPDSNLM